MTSRWRRTGIDATWSCRIDVSAAVFRGCAPAGSPLERFIVLNQKWICVVRTYILAAFTSIWICPLPPDVYPFFFLKTRAPYEGRVCKKLMIPMWSSQGPHGYCGSWGGPHGESVLGWRGWCDFAPVRNPLVSVSFFLSFSFFFFLIYAFSLIAHVLTSTLFRWQKVRRHYR